jgi:hypothetical protein
MLPGLLGYCCRVTVLERDHSMLGIHKPIMLNPSKLLKIDLLQGAKDLSRRVTLVTVEE